MDRDGLIELLEPVMAGIAGLDLDGGAREALEASWPLDSALMTAVRAACLEGLEAGWLCDREAGGVRFGRVCKASAQSHGLSVDAVCLSGPGVGHGHPAGEVDLGFCLEGEARFDGQAEGWVVYRPGTDHVPTVTGGTMLLLYFLPEGKIAWHR